MWVVNSYANDVEIINAKAEKQHVNWTIHVTLKHSDTGWDHYADAWRVVAKDGGELAKRTLYHPHVKEQPFTRSLANISIPSGVAFVYIEAHDNVHGWSKQRYKLKLR
ncbi:MAG: hypothetical protein GXP08_10420 [Gammaproteobacteria bacterium]|nr:hypothetical protein [Gammaproteobacteria bacterium]